MLMNQLFKKTATVCMALFLLVGLAFPAYAGVTVFDSNQSGNKVLSPRGYSVTAPVDGEEKELWLQSPFDHAYYDGINNKASVTQGSSDDSLEVESLDAGKYTFHLWIDKNPAGGALSGDINQYFAVYINGEETPIKLKELSGAPYEVVFGAAETSRTDPNGLEGQWSIEFSMNVLEGESYRFVFLRGVQANNGNTTVLFDSAANGKEGYIGYINGDSVTAEETAKFEKAKFDVYEYVSEKSELGKDANNYTVYALTLVPFEHVLKVNGGEEPTPAEPETPVHVHTAEAVKGKAATCTEKGLTDGKKCSVCGEWIEAQKEIPALGHKKAEPVKENTVASTCTKEGFYEEVVYCSECKTELSREKKTIDKLPHTEEVVKGKAATCTEKGLTDGKKCSVCGEILEAQKEIPALGHTEEVVKGKAATCTEKGLTDGKKCSVCGEILEAQKEIPALGHNYKDGVCTRCEAKDPNYKPAEPVPAEPEEPSPAEPEEPTPAEPDKPAPAEPEAPLNGIVKGKDGKWAMYKDDKVVTSYTGIAKNAYGWWRVENGYVNFNAQGIYRNEYGWWKTTDGKVTFDETGIFKNEYGWWRVEDSKVNFKAQEIYKNKYGWWKTTDGKVTFKENGVFRNDYGWWKVENSKVNFKFTGIASNKYGTWFVKDGKVDFHKNGKVKFEGKVYQVKDGRAKLA